jgi:hypothetical protein
VKKKKVVSKPESKTDKARRQPHRAARRVATPRVDAGARRLGGTRTLQR